MEIENRIVDPSPIAAMVRTVLQKISIGAEELGEVEEELLLLLGGVPDLAIPFPIRLSGVKVGGVGQF